MDTSGNGPTDEQRQKRKGIAAESLVASMCVLGSDGKLNVATSLIDDEGMGPRLLPVGPRCQPPPEGVGACITPRYSSMS